MRKERFEKLLGECFNEAAGKIGTKSYWSSRDSDWWMIEFKSALAPILSHMERGIEQINSKIDALYSYFKLYYKDKSTNESPGHAEKKQIIKVKK